MIVTKCPLRVSLVGGSSDLQPFLDKYDWGSVVSFPSNLYTYITLKKRLIDYRIVYSKIETVQDPKEIKNDIAREVLTHFGVGPVEIAFNTDIPSDGSGLASSSSYMISLIYAVSELLDLKLSRFDTCKLALELERKFNPLTGYQDPYGCGLGGFKRMIFHKNGHVEFIHLPSKILHDHTFYLVPTNVTRSSTKILSSIDIDSLIRLRDITNIFEKPYFSDYSFHNSIKYSWDIKKQSSPQIMTDELKEMENTFKKNEDISSYKLLGAGGGGYFLLVCKIPKPYIAKMGMTITVDDDGVKTTHTS